MLNEQNLSAGITHASDSPGGTMNPVGVLPIDKPANIGSFGVVARVKRLVPRGTKVGHAGTLDPFATGLLLVLIGKATRQCEAMMDQAKTYETTITLGATTETNDPTAPVMPWPDATPPALQTIQAALLNFVGSIAQRPPVYSALKVGGRRASDRVRDGETIELPPRNVQIYSIDLLRYEWPHLQLRIECGRGTYIRAIARDLGEMLNVGGYLTQLRRTRIGQYDVAAAHALDNLDQLPTSLYNEILR